MAKILYFVGAGLSKSLALPTRPIPAMFDFISTSAEYVQDDIILTTLAELENSVPYPYAWVSEAARTLAPQLVGRRRSNDPAIRSAFACALKQRPGESIEDLLDRTGGNASNMSSQSAETRFRFAIQRLFTVIGWDLDWNPLISFLMRQFKALGTAHTFVSFNYDLVLDRGIYVAAQGKVDLSHFYGFPIGLTVTGDPPPSMDEVGGGAFSGLPVTPLLASSTDLDAVLLKPHGSLNWLSPRKDEHEAGLETVVLPLSANGELRYLPTTNLPPWFQMQDGLPFAVEPVLLTPRGAKRPDREFLRELRQQEEAAILDADEVYVLGWSIPRTDTDQECLIRSTVAKRSVPLRRLTIVNYSAGLDYYQRVRDIFGVEQRSVQVFNSGFREFAGYF